MSVTTPRPHPRVVEAPLGEDVALFHLDTRRLHLLNGPAAAIWGRLRQCATVGELSVGLARQFGVGPESIRTDVERTVHQFSADGLLCSGEPVVSASMTVLPRTPWVAPARPVAAPATGSFAALDARVGIVSDDEEIAATISAVLGPLHCEDNPGVAIEIDAISESSWGITVGGRSQIAVGSRLSAVLRVIGEVNGLAVSSVPDDLVFHAGAVSDGVNAVLMPAAANHGKSTLTAALVADGLRYLTDEAATLTAELAVRPFAKSIALDPGSFPLFETLEPQGFDTGLARAMSVREWHVDPARVGTVGEAAPVAAVVCPYWRAGATTRVASLAPTEALHVLLGETFDFEQSGQLLFERLVRLVDTVPVFRLGFSDLSDAVATVRRILADPECG